MNTTWNSTYPPNGAYVTVATPGFPAWVIRTATHSWANHAFIMYDHDDGTIIEAQPGGVIKANIEKYAGCRMAWNLGDQMTDMQRLQVTAKAYSLIGVPYNDIDIFSLGLESLGFGWKWLAKLAASDDELICSQLVAVCGFRAGLKKWLCGKTAPSEVTPADLAARSVMRPLVL